MPIRRCVPCLLTYFCPFIQTPSFHTLSILYQHGFLPALIYTILIPSLGHFHLWSLLREHHRPLGSCRGGYFAVIYLLKALLEESPRSSCYVRNTRYIIMHIVYYHALYLLYIYIENIYLYSIYIFFIFI